MVIQFFVFVFNEIEYEIIQHYYDACITIYIIYLKHSSNLNDHDCQRLLDTHCYTLF